MPGRSTPSGTSTTRRSHTTSTATPKNFFAYLVRHQQRRLERHRHHRLPRRRDLLVRKSAGQRGQLEAALDSRRDQTTNRPTSPISRATACRRSFAIAAGKSAMPKCRRTIRRKPWKFHPITPNRKYQRFTHGMGHRRCEQRRPHRHPAERRLVGAAGRRFEGRVLEVSPGEVHRRWRLADVRVRRGWRRRQRRRHEQGGPRLRSVLVRKPRQGRQGRHQVQRTQDHGREARGERVRRRVLQLHAMALADMDHDGIPDIITGKRWWSHCRARSGCARSGRVVLVQNGRARAARVSISFRTRSI